ncbi:MAG TPA: ATP-binding protein [Acidimicrobiales bacterium]|nr:ATP-binding protein [Acidimicrobiales bacterium]
MRVGPATLGPYQRAVAGAGAALAGQGVLTLILVPWRHHLNVATPALVFVVPVILGVAIGGFGPGVVAAASGFILFDLFFLPPYGVFTVRDAQNWVTLVVYVVVVLVVARIVTNQQAAREEARRREDDANRLFELSQALIGDLSLTQMLDRVVAIVQSAFQPDWTALLLPSGAGEESELLVAARAGRPLDGTDLATLTLGGHTNSLGLTVGHEASRVTLALVASNRPVGMLVLHQVEFERQDRALLATFANQAALAIERAQLQEQALRSRLLEEIDRWRSAMMGAVSHDLRTPLSSVKTAVSSLRQDGAAMTNEDRAELLALIETQSDRLARLVTNLLDMTRIDSGALDLRPAPVPFDELAADAMHAVDGLLATDQVTIISPPGLPLLTIDLVLITQVVANLLENASRFSPPGSAIVVKAKEAVGGLVEISVGDQGPGIDAGQREQVFEMFSQHGGGGRAGLGLAIAKAFVEAHGGTIWVDPNVSAGTRLVFTVPGALTEALPV